MASSGKGSGSSDSKFGDILGGIAQQINREVDPLRKLMLSQMRSILNGNQFTNSTIPLIQSGVRAARDAGSASLMDTQKFLAQSGASSSPFASALESMTAMGTEQNIASVPGQVAGEYLGQIPGTVTGIGGQALSGLSSAAQTNRSYSDSSFNTDYGSNFLTSWLTG